MLINPLLYQQASNDENSTFSDYTFSVWGVLGKWTELDLNKIYYGTLSSRQDDYLYDDRFDPYVLKGDAGSYKIYLTSNSTNANHIKNAELVNAWWGPSYPSFSFKAYGGNINHVIANSYVDYSNGDQVIELVATGNFSVVIGVSWENQFISGSGFGYGVVAKKIIPNNSPTGLVNIIGTPTQNQTLLANNSIFDADGVGTIKYQWKANGIDISNAKSSTYELKQAEVGKTITVTASYIDKLGTAESVTSSATAKVANVNDVGLVKISGTSRQGQVLKAAVSDVDGVPTTGLKYQWLADGTAISGATASTFTLGQAQVGKIISVKASYTDKLGSAENVTSAATAKVANVNDVGVVKVSGMATQGQVLKAAVSDTDGLPTTGLKYQWLADGSAINGANSAAFTLTQAQVGKIISVKASYTDKLGTAESVTSATTAMIASPGKTGTTGKDVLGGSTGHDLLSGLAGNDVIYGGLGNDTLVGGAGSDRLTGGADSDRFKFAALTDLGLGATARDVISDFKRGADKIDLSGIDTNSALKGDQDFAWVTKFSATAGQVRFAADGQGNGILYLNTDKDVSAEYEIMLIGVTMLAASDLML